MNRVDTSTKARRLGRCLGPLVHLGRGQLHCLLGTCGEIVGQKGIHSTLLSQAGNSLLDCVTSIVHPVLDDLHSSLNIGAWQDQRSGTLIFRLFSVYLVCCQHYSHIFSCLFIFSLSLTIKGGDWLPGLPGGSPAA